MNLRSGAFRLFRVFGIDVYLHWTWFLLLVFGVQYGGNWSRNLYWSVLELLGIFAIVLLHEFGHSLAAKSVGGKSDTIVLWPLGGISYAQPPARAGAYLWTIVAGPLVNVVLAPILLALLLVTTHGVWPTLHGVGNVGGPVASFLVTMLGIDITLFVFNMLPIFPLDGGQVVRGILWFFVGEMRSLYYAATLGLVAAGLFLLWSLTSRQANQDYILTFIAVFMLLTSWRAWRYARFAIAAGNTGTHAVPGATVRRASAQPEESIAQPEWRTHPDAACPTCRAHPPEGPFSQCQCGEHFDMFGSRGVCPHCGTVYGQARCGVCGNVADIDAWYPSVQQYHVTSSIAGGPGQ